MHAELSFTTYTTNAFLTLMSIVNMILVCLIYFWSGQQWTTTMGQHEATICQLANKLLECLVCRMGWSIILQFLTLLFGLGVEWVDASPPTCSHRYTVYSSIYTHYYRIDLLSRAVTAFSPGYCAGTTILGLKVEPSVPGHRAGTKVSPAEQTWPHPLVPVGNPNRD